MSLSFNGPHAVAIYRAVALKHGLRLYDRTGMKPNRAWTPTNMLRAAGEITGEKYTRGEYARAMDDLDAWLETAKQKVEVITHED